MRICVLMLAILGLTLGARADEPKRYSVSLNAGRIGKAEFSAGEYKLLIHRDEGKAQILDLRTGDIKDLPGKVETAKSKFSNTEVHTKTVDGMQQVTEIRLGGTNYKVQFDEAGL